MNELSTLTAQREELLLKLRDIEANCERIENENNAKRVQELNLEQTKLTAQKNEISAQLTAVQGKLTNINNEIAILSETGVDRILEAIKNQRWYFFKNKPKVLMDRDTGLLWPNLTFYNICAGGIWEKCTRSFSCGVNTSFVEKLLIDNYSDWKLPKKQDIMTLLDDLTFPFFYNNKSNRCVKTNAGGYVFSLKIIGEFSNCIAIDGDYANIGNWDCGVLPRTDILVQNSDYENNVSPNNPVYTEKERLQFTLDLFVQNELWPIFDDNEITQLYKKIYFEKPELLHQLQEIQNQIEDLQTVTLLSSDFDYMALLAKYDVDSINNSIIKYYQAIQQWTDELMEKLDYYEQEKEDVIKDFNIIGLKLSKKYEVNANLTKEENGLLEERQRFFQKKFSLGMNSVKSKILSIKKQANDLEYSIDEIDNSDDAIHALALLE